MSLCRSDFLYRFASFLKASALQRVRENVRKVFDSMKNKMLKEDNAKVLKVAPKGSLIKQKRIITVSQV